LKTEKRIKYRCPSCFLTQGRRTCVFFFLLQPVQLLFCDLLPLSLFFFTSLLLSLCLAFDLAFCTSWPLIKDSNHSFLFHFVIIIIRYSIYSLYSTVSQAYDALTPIPSFIHTKKKRNRNRCAYFQSLSLMWFYVIYLELSVDIHWFSNDALTWREWAKFYYPFICFLFFHLFIYLQYSQTILYECKKTKQIHTVSIFENHSLLKLICCE
jgi:hypothetical protein